MDVQAAVVVDEAELPEFVDGEIDARRSCRPSRPDPLRRSWQGAVRRLGFTRDAPSSRCVRASRFSLGLKSWSNGCSSIRMYLVGMCREEQCREPGLGVESAGRPCLLLETAEIGAQRHGVAVAVSCN